ncbi:hypothetical protein S40288_08703 [Stachybotrys chartarum IBT 40288]|nr:hypothetical protein S40288_08703 [Stachybotrys chartarum IBT 40288]
MMLCTQSHLARALCAILLLCFGLQFFYLFFGTHYPSVSQTSYPPTPTFLHCYDDDTCFPLLQESLAIDVERSGIRCRNSSEPSDAVVRYATRMATVTAQFGDPQPHYEQSLRSQMLNSRIHGGQLHVLRRKIVDDLWNKPAFILSILLLEMSKPENERVEWLFWVDRDVVILDTCRSPASFLPLQLQNVGEDGIKYEKSPDLDHIQLLVTEDWNGLNNGVFLLRVSRWSIDLFSAILSYRYYKPDVKLPFTEQSAMEILLKDDQFRDNAIWVPQWWFNAYPGPLETFIHDKQLELEDLRARPGDFLVHFAGVAHREEAMIPWLQNFNSSQEKGTWTSRPWHRNLDEEINLFWSSRAWEKVVTTLS